MGVEGRPPALSLVASLDPNTILLAGTSQNVTLVPRRGRHAPHAVHEGPHDAHPVGRVDHPDKPLAVLPGPAMVDHAHAAHRDFPAEAVDVLSAPANSRLAPFAELLAMDLKAYSLLDRWQR